MRFANNRTLNNFFSNETLIVSVAIMLILAILYGQVLNAQFLLKDDWPAVPIVNNKTSHPQIAAYDADFDSFWYYSVERELKFGRFRPAYWLLFTIEAHVLRSHATLWYGETLLSAFFTCLLFWLSLRKLGLHTIPAFIGVLGIIFPGMRIWLDISLAEDPGMLWLMFGIYSLIRSSQSQSTKWNYIALLSLFFATLFKETFILVIPSLLVLRVLAELHFQPKVNLLTSLRRYSRFWIIASTLFLLQTALAAWLYTNNGYGTSVIGSMDAVNRFSPFTWIRMLLPWRLYLAYFLPSFGVLIWIFSVTKRKETRLFVFGAMVAFLLWTVPQAIMYAKSGFLNHYFFPAVVAFAALNAWGTQGFKNLSNRFFYIVIVSFVFLTALYRTPMTISFVNYQVAYTRASYRLIMETREVLDGNSGNLLLITDPFLNIPLSFTTYLTEGLDSAPQIYWHPVTDNRFNVEEIQAQTPTITPLFPLYTSDVAQSIAIVSAMQVLNPTIEFEELSLSYGWSVIEVIEPYVVININLRQLHFKIERVEYHFQLYILKR